MLGLFSVCLADNVLVMEATRGDKVLADREALAARGLRIRMQAMWNYLLILLNFEEFFCDGVVK